MEREDNGGQHGGGQAVPGMQHLRQGRGASHRGVKRKRAGGL